MRVISIVTSMFLPTSKIGNSLYYMLILYAYIYYLVSIWMEKLCGLTCLPSTWAENIYVYLSLPYMFSFYVEDRHDRPYPFLSLMNDCRNKNKYFLLKHGASDLLDK